LFIDTLLSVFSVAAIRNQILKKFSVFESLIDLLIRFGNQFTAQHINPVGELLEMTWDDTKYTQRQGNGRRS